MHAISRHERVLDDDVVAAGASEAGGVPGIDDLVIAFRHEIHAPFRHAVGTRRIGWHESTKQRPIAVKTAAGERPASADAKTAFDRYDLAGRREREPDQRVRILAPHVLRRAIVEQRHHPLRDADHPIDPARRHIAFGERHLDLVIGADIDLVTAPALRLQRAEEAGGTHFVDQAMRHASLAIGLGAAFDQLRNEAARPGDQLRRRGINWHDGNPPAAKPMVAACFGQEAAEADGQPAQPNSLRK